MNAILESLTDKSPMLEISDRCHFRLKANGGAFIAKYIAGELNAVTLSAEELQAITQLLRTKK